MKEYGSAYEMSSIQRTRRITEIQEELLGLREIVDSNYHLTNPDGEDTGEYANTITDTISELEAELEKIMNDPEQMKYAYITEADVQSLMSNNKIKTPYVLVEASENTKIDYFIPPSRDQNEVDSEMDNVLSKGNGGDTAEDSQYQILIDSKNPINLYFAMDHK